jgi:DNA primase
MQGKKRTWEIDWKDAKTLEQTVIEMIEKGETETDAFKTLEKWYSKDRILRIWIDYLERQKKSEIFQENQILAR